MGGGGGGGRYLILGGLRSATNNRHVNSGLLRNRGA